VSTASGRPSPNASPDPTPTPTIYVVQTGDTLFRIALNHGVSVEQLVAWNVDRYPSLAGDAGTIRVGWELVVGGEGSLPSAPPPTSAPPAPPPAASGCHAGTRAAAGSAQVFDRVPTDEQAVALTFDMGGRLDPGVDILNFLIANGVCATLFPTGAMTQTAQGQAVMAIVRAHPELFEVGNHTMFHCDLVRGGGGSPTAAPCAGGPPSADRIRAELTDAAAIIRDATGQDPAPYWRPPYGSWNQGVIDAAASVGYAYTFMWDIDTIDWKPIADGGPNASQIASNVVSRAVAGSNVLMHLGGYETLAALPTMVQGLRDRGFTITSISDLLD
jgi:peptidoglycan/xylan/chitin deacetylase (PgdA/CDA1 family)